MSVEAWTASQGMLEHWAFLDREGQHEDDRSRVVLDAEPVLDLLAQAQASCIVANPREPESADAIARIEALLRTHGRLR